MLLTTKEAAEKLRRTESCLEAWRCRGGGPPYVKVGRAVFYREEDLEKFILDGLRRNTSEPGQAILQFTKTGEVARISIVCSDSDQEERLRAALDRILKDAPKEGAA